MQTTDMRSTDSAKSLNLTSPSQGIAVPSELPASAPSLHPIQPTISLADRLKAVGLVVLTGAVGVGVVVVGRNLRLANTEETLAPLPSSGSQSGRDRSQLAPLGDRLPIITPGSSSASGSGFSSVSPPESFLTSPSEPSQVARSLRSRRSLQATLPRVSHGFGSGESTGIPADELADTSEADSAEVADSSTSDLEAESSASLSSPDPEATETSSEEPSPEELAPAVATLLAPAKASSVAKPNQSDGAVQDVITALLAAPPSSSPPVAIAPHSLLSKLPVSPLSALNTESSEPEAQTPSPSPPLPAIATPEPAIAPAPSAPTVATSLPPEIFSLPVTPAPSPSIPAPDQPSITAPEVVVPSLTPPSSATNATPPATTALVIPPAIQSGVYVDRIKITGNTRFSQQQLAEIVQKTIATSSQSSPTSSEISEGAIANAAQNLSSPDPTVLNRQLPLTALVQASEAITKLYIEKGYINSGAYVPAEVLKGEPPEIRVVEGKLEDINIQKVQRPGFLWLARPLSKSYVRRRLARSIRTPLQIDQLADSVQLLEQDPLIESISTTLAPGTTTGGSILNVEVKQASPLRTSFSVDNGRSPSVGRLQQQFSLSHFNLLGLGDALQFGYNRSEGSRGWNANYSLPINAKNGTLSFNYSQNRGEVIEQPFRDLDIKSRSQSYELALRQPLKQTSTELVALSLRASRYHNEGVFLETFNNGVALPLPGRGSDPDGETNITALRFGQEWLKRGKRDVFSLQSDFSVGINALGATRLDMPPDGRFLSWQGRGFWVHSFAPDTLLSVKSQLQLANRPLVPVEQLSLGGIDTVRGYRTSTLLADNGAFASAELYLPVLRMSKGKSVVQVVPFFDIGRGWNKGDDQPLPNFLMSTGLGLQWKVSDTFRARLDWGIPLVNAKQNGQSLKEGLFFSVTFTP